MKYLAVALLVLSVTAEASDKKTDVILANYQKHPILALLPSEQLEAPLKQIGYTKARANAVCDFLRQPAGSFRSRRAENVLTEVFQHTLSDTKMAVLEKQSDGSVRASLATVGKNDRPEVIKSLRCVGSN
jgi:hypothetical protein